MKNQSYLNLTSHQFKRGFGVKISTLKVMVKALEEFRSENPLIQKRAWDYPNS